MSETLWRLSVFIGVLLLMVLWELVSPKRKPRYKRRQRWPANLAIVAVDNLLLRIVAPAGLVGVALFASEKSLGLFHALTVNLPFWLTVVISIVLLDIAIYWQHRLFHRVPVLWRMHRVHHADPDFDVTTGLRFHPAEIVLSFFIKGATILVLGAPALAVVLFEIILNACSLFNHGNVELPKPLEKIVRKILITQELHRIHHSVEKEETNSNYGFSVSWWDHLFDSFTDRPKAGSDNIDIGLRDYRDSKITTKLWELLKIPFKRD
ncbi:sterol desaturase family protein [Idiomarina sp. HP20-50]|uniref:sterol desaturase family protein n=1 Tax=Idiomarina sp. HP20-50 TaxID=3070813 RepID=UPI00294B8665|nr:sterol desaturase family protein [Idiomarina sp. HP20-50]MDV6316999.1 sterol desaturase family protein [Idiomarina sp. HP20-50]